MNLNELNKKYAALMPRQRIEALYTDFSKILYTSSFGTTAVYLLHIFSKVHPGQTIHFLDTTYHFPETLKYKEELTGLLNLKVISLKGDEWRNKFTQQDKTWEKDPDLCCSVNKVEPLELIKPGYEVWVSGLMRSQNDHRKDLDVFIEKDGLLRFYPIIDQTEEDAESYIRLNNLPRHPLTSKEYHSVGCTHCTTQGRAREGRWINKSKSECGLHL
jgi:phosphoadenosine phosphosulfate reductase